MAIQLQTTSRGELSANSTSVSAPVPSGTVAGDVLVAELSAQSGSAAPDQTGWVTLAGSAIGTISANLYLRVATGTEGATVTFTGLPSGGHSLQVARWSGVDTANAIDAPGVGFSEGTTTNFIDAPSLTITTPGAVAIYGLGIQSGGSTRFFTPPSGVTLVAEDDPANGFSRRGFIFQEPRTAAGATGTRRFAMSASLPQAGAAFALRPAVETGPTVPTVNAGAATVLATAQGATTGVHATSGTAVARASASSITGNAAGEIHVTSGTASAGARATASTSSTRTGTGVARARASALASTVTSRATVASATVRAVAAGTVTSLHQTQGVAVARSLASSEVSSLRLTLGDAPAYATATSLTQQVGYIPPRITFDVVDATLTFDGVGDATIHFDGASDALVMSDGEGVAILAVEQLATAVLLDVRDYAATLATDGESHATLDSDGVSSATLHTP